MEIDTHAAEDLALGFGDIGVAGSDDAVHGRDALRPEGQGGHGLRAADPVDLVHAGDAGSGQYRRIERPARCRDAHGDAGHAGHAGRDGIHQDR